MENIKDIGKGVVKVGKGATKKGFKGAVKGLTQTTKVAAKTAKYAGKGASGIANVAGKGVTTVGTSGFGAIKSTAKMTGLISKKGKPAKASTTAGIDGDLMEDIEGEQAYYNEQQEMMLQMGYVDEVSMAKANHILSSAGTHRLNKILRKINNDDEEFHNIAGMSDERSGAQKIQKLEDPRNPTEVSMFVANVVLPPLRVDHRSIGGTLFEEYPENMVQETLLCFKCKSFELTGTDHISVSCLENPATYAKHKRSLGLFGKGTKGRNKVHYVILARSTNRPLLSTGKNERKGRGTQDLADAGYDKMFSPGNDHLEVDDEEIEDLMTEEDQDGDMMEDMDMRDPEEHRHDAESDLTEVSSFPAMACLSLNSDGTNPDIRKLIELDQLTTVQDVTATVVQLAFQNGDTVRFDFSEDDEDKAVEAGLVKERFIWSLLQIHAMLCVSVVERSSLANTTTSKDRVLLPPLNIRNLDRGELQYVATVNSFLKADRTLCALLDRQRELARDKEEGPTKEGGEEKEEKVDDLDGMAYDLMMGNFATRVAIFHSADERAEAEEILNSTEWTLSLNSEESAAANAAERLSLVLQRRMRDLEAETCRRLIAWEDEKHFSVTGQAGLFAQNANRDTVDALSLAHLFTTLESLDRELSEMEDWLEDRVLAIKPLTDDCRDIEEENRQLEQQWKSYDLLGSEMRRLLKGLVIDEELELILGNPASALVYDEAGNIQVEESEEGVDHIYDAGKALQEATEHAEKAGGLHLRAVSERVEALAQASDFFCTALAQIIVTIMEQFKTEVVAASDHGKVSKQDTHSMIAKKVRDTQRKFQSSLLGYIKLIEVMALLNPKLLPAIRDAYAEMVAEGILMKKRMKGYFQALPGKNTAYLSNAAKDLKDYSPYEPGTKEMTVNAEDIKFALSELLPVVAREAYFTAALFGLSSKAKDGREKKRNFEAAKKSVDHSTQYFRYYVQRTCGIADDTEKDPTTRHGDPMLSLVASIHLNEAMENYIDREKKGGDHSLSLAYVRATILELRKKVDKQWVAWVEQQIDWIRSNPGVPMNGKRAGIFPAFARFPCYIDHILLCCREGRKETFSPDLANIKVVSYYLQKLATALLESLRTCAERETTDQQYAASVMQMENSYFFTQSMKNRGNEITALFQKQITKANAVCKASTDSYLGWMIKREFKSLHALFSNISKIRREVGDKDVPVHIPKATFIRTLAKETSREVMKEKIAIIYSRMEKHLSEEGGLLPVAWKALVKVLYEWFGRWEKLSSQIYKHVLEPSAVDVVRIAKAAGAFTGPDDRTSLRNTSGDGSDTGLSNGVGANRASMAQF
ncbi:exocyst complex component Sec3 [Nitzschia inconspicua]|uniref:Exocyst complex component Sec3 n=1 Tax=Nitzschia inconspicua TaxID=303405 RepID=A0A9K3PR02_9STRA|nr:exocyst complex component Sec3 [Nitzschia inconspicua]